MLLVKDVGLSLRDIRGKTVKRVTYEERTDFIARLRQWLPFIKEPPEKVVRRFEEEPGMSEDEILRFFLYHDEQEQMKSETIEEERQEIRRKQGNIGNQGGNF